MEGLLEQIMAHINITVLVTGLLFTIIIWWYSNKKNSRQLRNYLPNIWTSLGILGTFVSIVFTFKGEDVDWTNINQLVTNIVPAFETSIIGIIGAILTSVFAKMKYANEDYSVNEAYLKKYKMTPEQHVGTINQQMTQLLTVTQRQHNALMQESKKQRSLAERMITEFTVNLRDFYDKLYEEENQHAQEMVDQYLAGINQLIMSTHETIKDKFETLFTDHSEALKKLMDNEEESFNKLTNSITTALNTNSQAIIKSVSDIGLNEIDTLGTISETQKEQLQAIVDENKRGLAQIVKDNSEGLTRITEDASLNLTKTANEFTALIGALKTGFEALVNGVPDSMEQIKNSLVGTINELANDKFEVLSDAHKVFVNGLLQKVEEFEQQISNQSKENQKDWSKAVNAHLTKMLNQVDADVKGHVILMQETSQGMNEELTAIIDSLKKATTNYTTINKQITTLVDALQKETNATEVYANSVSSTSTQLAAIQKLLTDIANKNLQLRQELAQWKRTHKQVKVDTEKGIKVCPNCKAENPIDASYCRKCATSFWECEPVAKSKKTDE